MGEPIKRPEEAADVMTGERCWILEVSNDPEDGDASIARARVEPGVITERGRAPPGAGSCAPGVARTVCNFTIRSQLYDS